jgi:hypothetical protein
MVVWRIAIVVFVDAAAIQLKATQKPGVDKLFERSVDGGPRYVIGRALAGQLFDQLVGVKVLMMAEDLVDQKSTLIRIAQITTLQVLLKSLVRRHRDLHIAQR